MNQTHYIIRTTHPQKDNHFIEDSVFFSLTEHSNKAEVFTSYVSALRIINSLYNEAREVENSLMIGHEFQIVSVETVLGVPARIEPPAKQGWLVKSGESYLTHEDDTNSVFGRYMNAICFPNRLIAVEAAWVASLNTGEDFAQMEFKFTGINFPMEGA